MAHSRQVELSALSPDTTVYICLTVAALTYISRIYLYACGCFSELRKMNYLLYDVITAAARRGEFISLKFTSMVTECSYDYVFVYDGQTYDSPLLGSFSGGTKPDVLTATSQHVCSTLIYVKFVVSKTWL